jgi:hypothetical protein
MKLFTCGVDSSSAETTMKEKMPTNMSFAESKKEHTIAL